MDGLECYDLLSFSGSVDGHDVFVVRPGNCLHCKEQRGRLLEVSRRISRQICLGRSFSKSFAFP